MRPRHTLFFRAFLFRLSALLPALAAGPALAMPPPFVDGLEGPPVQARPYPAQLDENTRYYRGMDERQAPLVQVVSMIAGLTDAVIPSRRMSTLKDLHPAAGQAELLRMLDSDLAFWRSGSSWFALASCHSDSFDCPVTDIGVLQATSFPDLSFLPADQLGNARFWPNAPEPWRILRPMDPVISTSIDLDVARAFTRRIDQERPTDPAAYTLILKDSRLRNCPSEYRRPAEICIITRTEYADEAEMPFWNYILPVEVDAVERGEIRVRRGSRDGTLRLTALDRSSPGSVQEKPLPDECFTTSAALRPGARRIELAPACPVRIDSKLRSALIESRAALTR